jgi:CBS domain-containing protein
MELNLIMTREVETLLPDDNLELAARRMRDRDVGSLPVWDRRRLIGILTDRDITVRATAFGGAPWEIRVRTVMTPDPICCYEDQDVRAAARLMEQHQVRRLPVLRRDGGLAGIVALADLSLRSNEANLPAAVLRQVSRAAEPEREHNGAAPGEMEDRWI